MKVPIVKPTRLPPAPTTIEPSVEMALAP